MTTTPDTAAEMAFEAVLAGRPLPPGAGGLAAFTEAVLATATEPGRPHPALAELLATGLTVDPPESAPDAAERWRRPVWFVHALSKIASAGAVVKVAAAAGIVVVAVTGAGAAGVLPTDAQHGFAQVVETATSLQVPDPHRGAEAGTTTSESPAGTTTEPSETPTAESGSTRTPSPAGAMPPDYDCDPSKSFGACVSRHKHAADGPLTPAQVDEWARYYHAQRAGQQETTDQSRTLDPASTKTQGSGNSSGKGSTGRGQTDASRGTVPGQGRR